MKKIVPLFIAVAIILSLVVLTSKRREAPTSEKKIRVVTSFYPLYFLAQSLGGTHVEVSNITPPGVEPHDYEPTALDIARIHGAHIVVLNGGGLESYQRSVIEMIKGSSSYLIIVLKDSSQDPHSWLDPVMFADTADKIASGLRSQDPIHKAYYEERLKHVHTMLMDLDSEYKKSFINCTRNTFVTSHKAFSYVARRYGLQLVHIAGISPEDEPNPRSMGTVAEFVKRNQIPTIFFEELVSPKLSETIARETGARTDVLSPIEGLTAEQQANGKTYIHLQKDNMIKLSRALGCKPL